jgi:uncharacterized membrane protein
MGMALNRRRSYKPAKLWVAPVIGAICATVLAVLALLYDALTDPLIPALVFRGQADTARMILQIIASSVTTLLALIFTVIAVVIQLASGHYSARILTTLLADRPSHFTIGVFVGTFTYALVILMGFDVMIADDSLRASGISMTIAFLLAVITIGTFAVYANHIIHAVRITSLVGLVGHETRRAIERQYPDPLTAEEESAFPGDRAPDAVVPAPRSGILVGFNLQALVAAATRKDVIVVLPAGGAFTPEGAPLVEVYGGDVGDISSYLQISQERSFDRDVSYGLRLLADIALRATSTGVNDPASAVQAIDHLHDALRQLMDRDLGDRVYTDEEGHPRLIEHTPGWLGLLRVAAEDILITGASSPQVARRLNAMLYDLAEHAPSIKRREEVHRLMGELTRLIDRSYDDEMIRRLAKEPDLRGTGF